MSRVAKVVQTCGACPSQWDITLADGTYLYARYRWGSLTISEGVGGPAVVSKSVGDGYDGVMGTDEMLRHLLPTLATRTGDDA